MLCCRSISYYFQLLIAVMSSFLSSRPEGKIWVTGPEVCYLTRWVPSCSKELSILATKFSDKSSCTNCLRWMETYCAFPDGQEESWLESLKGLRHKHITAPYSTQSGKPTKPQALVIFLTTVMFPVSTVSGEIELSVSWLLFPNQGRCEGRQ